MSEYDELGRVVAERMLNLRLRRGAREGLYVLVNEETHEPETVDDLTADEVRKLCAGQRGLVSLRQPARAP